MTQRMAKLDRLLALVHALAEDAEGLTLEAMAERMGVSRRTAERMRNVLMTHFELEARSDGSSKSWRITGRLGRMFTQPTAQEIAALQAEVQGKRKRGQHARADLLASLQAKVQSAMDTAARRRTGPDLEALAKVQRVLVPAGATAVVPHDAFAAVQGAIMAGAMIEFEYQAEGSATASWRRVIPFGLIHGPLSYLVGKIPDTSKSPVYFRLDRMKSPRLSELPGIVPDDFDLDAWLAESFGVWRDEPYDVVLRIKPPSVARAREWRFHPNQSIHEETGGTLSVNFRASGLQELAEHLFSWGSDIEIIAPDELRAELVSMLAAASKAHG